NSNLFGSPGLERPVINALTGAPASVLVSLPATFAGGVAFTSESRMWGAEATFVRNLASDCHFHADLLFRFRFLDLEENLNVGQTSLVLGGSGIGPAPGVPFPGTSGFNGPGSVFALSDSFSTRNQFYGGQVGARAGWRYGLWSLDVHGKVGL